MHDGNKGIEKFFNMLSSFSSPQAHQKGGKSQHPDPQKEGLKHTRRQEGIMTYSFSYSSAAASAASLLFALCLFASPAAAADDSAMKYPSCWVRMGECLDSNAGPLKVGVTPQMNPNVIGESVKNVESFEECSSLCFRKENETCRWFTYYEKTVSAEERQANPNDTCRLVGFNLKQACFNLEKTCVLLKECATFDTSCKYCKVKTYACSFIH